MLDGLQDRLLGVLLAHERPVRADARALRVVRQAAVQRQAPGAVGPGPPWRASSPPRCWTPGSGRCEFWTPRDTRVELSHPR